ncbi:MAG TPA: hypothetical protein VNW28_01815, partial [Chthoniobacterales bacterium]|nr:hypothetical protein [Chthoniobacterales bacterium]
MKTLPFVLAAFAAATVLAQAQETIQQPDQAKLEAMTARFAPTEITADVSQLSPNDRKVLAKLVEASQIIDGIFLRQSWAGNPSMLLDLAGRDSAEDRARLHYFILNRGPWSNLEHNAPFVLGAPQKPAGAGFYPPNATKVEIEA